jgi:hypothetical protein
MGTAALVKTSRISGSAWSRESKVLAGFGLLTSEERKVLSGKRIRRIKHHQLTDKGNEVAKNIYEISLTLSQR